MQPTQKPKNKKHCIKLTNQKTRPQNKFGIDYFKKRTKIKMSFFQKPSRLYFYIDEHYAFERNDQIFIG